MRQMYGRDGRAIGQEIYSKPNTHNLLTFGAISDIIDTAEIGKNK